MAKEKHVEGEADHYIKTLIGAVLGYAADGLDMFLLSFILVFIMLIIIQCYLFYVLSLVLVSVVNLVLVWRLLLKHGHLICEQEHLHG